MKVPSLVISVLFVVAIAVVNAVLGYFNVGGPGADYAYSAIIVAVVSAIGRYIQEQQVEQPKVVTSTVKTASGDVETRSRAVVSPTTETKSPTRQALFG